MVSPWPMIMIGDVLEFKNGLNKGKEFFGNGTPIVNYTDVYHHRGLKKADIRGKVTLSPDEIMRFAARKNDVFFTRTSETPEEVGFSSVLLEDIDDCTFSGFILRARPKNDWLLPEYCQFCFSTKSVREEIIRNCTYTTRALTNGKVLSRIEIPLPSPKEQKAIVDALSSFDDHIHNLTELIEKKKWIRDGALEDLVSGRTRIDGFDGETDNLLIKSLVKLSRGKRLVRSQLSEQAINRAMFPVFQNSMLPLGYYEKYNCPAQSLFIIAAGSAGEIGFSENPFWAADDCFFFRHNEKIHQKYLYYALLNQQSYIYAQTRRTAIPRLSIDILENISIRVPSISEQKAVINVLTAMDEEISALEAEKEKMIQIREGAMDDLLTGRVRLPVEGE